MAFVKICLALLLLVQLTSVAHAYTYSVDDNWDNYYDTDYFIDYGQADGEEMHNYTSDEVFNVECNSTIDCVQAVHGFSICVYYINGGDTRKCACDVDVGYRKMDLNCSLSAALGDLCLTDVSDCTDPNAACQEDGTNSGQRRCLCVDGYAELFSETNNTYQCGALLHTRLDPTCASCESNEGKCYDSDGDGVSDGCICPASRTGTDCGEVLVTVHCVSAEFTMYVCYTPHPGLNFSLEAVFHVDGLLDDPACRGFLITADDLYCDIDQYKLVLPLDDDQRSRCDTIKVNPVPSVVKYENRLVAHNERNRLTSSDPVFKTYCSFQQFSDGSFQALGVISINRNDRGEHKPAAIHMDVENLLGKKIPAGVSLRLGDKIRLRIKLDTDGTYSAIRVLRCTASTKPTVPDPKAVTVPLIINSCPYPRQNLITYKNTWYRVALREVQTGSVRVFKMAQGDSVHIHCAVKICLAGMESDCDPVQCRTPHSFPGMGRRKRDTDMDYVDPEAAAHSSNRMDVVVSRELNIIDPDATDMEVGGKMAAQPPYLIIVLGIVVVLVFSLIIVAIVMFRRLTRRLEDSNDDDDEDFISTLTSDTDSPSSGSRGYTMVPKEMGNVSQSSSGFGSPGATLDFDHLDTSCSNMIVRDTPAYKQMTNC